jgi:Ca2+-binding EF-hand superfamily protein
MPDGDASVFVDQIFRIFDKDENGSIDFNVSFLSLIFKFDFLNS